MWGVCAGFRRACDAEQEVASGLVSGVFVLQSGEAPAAASLRALNTAKKNRSSRTWLSPPHKPQFQTHFP